METRLRTIVGRILLATIAVITMHVGVPGRLLVTAAWGAPGSPPAKPSPRATTPDDGDPTKSGPSKTLNDAQELYDTGAYDEAIAAYQALAKSGARVDEARRGLARCRLQTGQYAIGIAELQRAVDDREQPGELSAPWHDLMAELHRHIGEYEDSLRHARAAIRIDPDDAGARLAAGQVLELLGRRDEAIAAYEWFEKQIADGRELPRDAAWLTNTALGFLRYSVLTRSNVVQRTRHALNEMLQQAYERIDRTYWPARIAAADLLREKHNNDESHGSISDYRGALRINANLPQALVGIGEVALEAWNFEEVEQRVDRALAINPHCAPALHLLARKLVTERRYEQAIEACDRALETNPNDLAALSLSAAASACRFDDDAVARMAKRVAAINPRCALYHRTVGDALGGIRQYAESEQAYLKAIEFDPTDANARTELGMMYMQWGREAKARDALDAAWALDPFNERTKFTLELLDQLDEFDRIDTPHFVVKYVSRRDPGLGPYVASFLEDIYEQVTGDYETALDEKTLIELFPTHRAFGVRITGKPWIHTIGACTGRVIALASPRDAFRIMGPYHIEHVLRHEFTHTVTLAMTKNRIPHWFTEGLAVWQENTPRSFSWMEILADAARRGTLFTLESVDWGFMRPRRPNDRQMAYAQSEWMCEFIAERFGYDLIPAMLDDFRRGRTQPQILQDRFGLQTEEFDKAFQTWARGEVARWGFDVTEPDDPDALRAQLVEQPDDPALIGRLAKAEFDAGRLEAAMSAAQRAHALDDGNRDALTVLAESMAMMAKEAQDESAREMLEQEALPLLERLMKVDPESWIAPKYLADVALRRRQFDRATDLLQRLQRLCPMDPASWRGLAGLYLQRDEVDRALPQLIELARIDASDAGVPARIAQIYRRKGRLREALYWYRNARYIDPANEELHEALGDTAMQSSDTRLALDTYRVLTEMRPDAARYFEKAAVAAHKLGDHGAANDFARRAVALDPTSDARSLLP